MLLRMCDDIAHRRLLNVEIVSWAKGQNAGQPGLVSSE